MLYPPWSLIIFGGLLGIGLLLSRIPAVWLATAKSGMGRTERSLITVMMPRGMAAGVLAILPFQKGVSDSEFLPVVVFSCVVTTLLLLRVVSCLQNRLMELSARPLYLPVTMWLLWWLVQERTAMILPPQEPL